MLIPYSLTVFVFILAFVLSLYDFYERRGAQMRLGAFPFAVSAISILAAIVDDQLRTLTPALLESIGGEHVTLVHDF